MRKILLSALLFTTLIISASAQLVVQIDAGSRAPYGDIQSLTIDKKGKCRYVKYDVSTNAIKDSSSFFITEGQLQDFMKKADDAGFFRLEDNYVRGVDGAGIFISLNNGINKKGVNVKNTDVAAVNTVVEFLNTILQSRKIRIYYGQQTN